MGIETTKKLAYLAETKSLIKAALIEKGQSVSDTDTFRSYADKVLAIETGGGSVEGVHYVTFMSHDGTTELYKRMVVDGDDCADPVKRGYIPAPTKASTAQYNYSHVGWATTPNGAWDEDALKAVTEDKTVYAAFASAVRYYTITYYDSDGTTVLDTQSVAYGSTPSYTPTKEGFVLDHWVPDLAVVTGNASYTAVWASALAAGVFKSGVTWSLMADGVFTISGEGETDSYNNSNIPWNDHMSSIRSVVVEDGVTMLGNYLFYKAYNLTNVSLPGSLLQLVGNTFRQCTGLLSISIPEGVTKIGEYSFQGCTLLASVILPDSLVEIGGKLGMGVFNGCTGLTSVTIPGNVTVIGYGAFQNCSKLAKVIFDDTDGWSMHDYGATALTSISVTDPATNAKNLVTTYYKKVWEKS